MRVADVFHNLPLVKQGREVIRLAESSTVNAAPLSANGMERRYECFRFANAPTPRRPAPNNHTAAGRGTGFRLVKSIRAKVDGLNDKPCTFTSNLLPENLKSLLVRPNVVSEGSTNAELIVGGAALSKVNMYELRKPEAKSEFGAELAKPMSIKSLPALIETLTGDKPLGLLTARALTLGISIPGSFTVTVFRLVRVDTGLVEVG